MTFNVNQINSLVGKFRWFCGYKISIVDYFYNIQGLTTLDATNGASKVNLCYLMDFWAILHLVISEA